MNELEIRAHELFNKRDFVEAFKLYEEALQQGIVSAKIFRNLGMIFSFNGKKDLAVDFLLKALELDPKLVLANSFLGKISYDCKHFTLANDYFQRELAINPELSKECFLDIGMSFMHTGQVEQGVHYYLQGTRFRNQRMLYGELLCNMHHCPGLNNQNFYDIAAECYQRFLEKTDKPKTLNDFSNIKKDKNKKLKVGFLSSCFNKFTAEYHLGYALDSQESDQRSYEILIYTPFSSNKWDIDVFKNNASKITNLDNLKAMEIAQIIKDDGVDILLDLRGHVYGSFLEVMAYKPAPIQISWLNYFGTTAMPEVDYVLADKYVLPEEFEKFYIEKVYRLENYFFIFKPRIEDLYIEPEPPCMKNGYITFASFHRGTKLNNEVLKYWSKILNRVEKSKLLITNSSLMDPDLETQYLKIFKEHGVREDRIIFHPYPEFKEFLELFNQVDICVDTFPFVGGTTTYDSLFMGVPVISCLGETWVGRSGYATLYEAGFPELTAENFEQAVDKNYELSQDIERLKNYRKNMRKQFLNSPVCNLKAFANKLEKAFRDIWHEYCEKN